MSKRSERREAERLARKAASNNRVLGAPLPSKSSPPFLPLRILQHVNL